MSLVESGLNWLGLDPSLDKLVGATYIQANKALLNLVFSHLLVLSVFLSKVMQHNAQKKKIKEKDHHLLPEIEILNSQENNKGKRLKERQKFELFFNSKYYRFGR